MTVIALDVMSGDLGAQECVPAALCALQDDPLLELKLVGQPETLEALLRAAAPRLRCVAGSKSFRRAKSS